MAVRVTARRRAATATRNDRRDLLAHRADIDFRQRLQVILADVGQQQPSLLQCLKRLFALGVRLLILARTGNALERLENRLLILGANADFARYQAFELRTVLAADATHVAWLSIQLVRFNEETE